MISVIVPVYNVERYLSECIESIIAQTYRDIEIILVDDGSTDSSGNLCDKLVKADSRIKVIHKNNGGLSSARNAGLILAKGEYITFIDSDDFIDSNMFDFMMNKFNIDSSLDIVSCCYETFVDGTKNYKPFLSKINSGRFSNVEYLNLILKHQVDNGVCNKIYRRRCLEKIHFIEGRINEDVLFNVSVLLEINYIYYIKKPFYKYRTRKGSITRQVNPSQFDYIINALDICEQIRNKYDSLFNTALEGYLCHEMTNFMTILELHNSKKRFKKEFKYCRSYMMSHFFRHMNNKEWSKTIKIRFMAISFCPLICRFIYRITH